MKVQTKYHHNTEYITVSRHDFLYVGSNDTGIGVLGIGRYWVISDIGGGDSRVVASRTSKQEGPGSIPGGGKEV